MTTAKLSGNTEVYCLRKPEAFVLDSHVEGYMINGIHVKEGDTVFDVGANIGVFGVRMLQKGPTVKVFAFEPIPDIYQVLKANSQKFGSARFVALNCGLSDANGEAEFTYFPHAPALSTSNPGMWDEDPDMFKNAVEGSLKNAPKEMWYAKLVPSFMSGFMAKMLRSGGQKFKCQLRTISSVIDEYDVKKIDLLKIDCEGAELSVLLGLQDKHWEMVSQLVVEVHDTEGRLDRIQGMCIKHGLTKIVAQKEQGFESTKLINLYATR
ncbi:MAG: FkbM family methyltransferase [Bacteroidia bacterium]|nr:FkbM family methyltransferase [Bacteroidia bacterium]